MDEPTAALGVKESAQVLDLIRRVRDRGLPVVLISHNMPHVFEIADRIHVQRLGRRVAVVEPRDHDMAEVVAIMTGALRVGGHPGPLVTDTGRGGGESARWAARPRWAGRTGAAGRTPGAARGERTGGGRP